jgi:hypothetical protein
MHHCVSWCVMACHGVRGPAILVMELVMGYSSNGIQAAGFHRINNCVCPVSLV